MGIRQEEDSGSGELVEELMQTILEIRKEAKARKDFHTADQIRNSLEKLNIRIMDTKEGARWVLEK